ncbi:PRC-barrel domain-containing protein [Archangium sp.]|uniref:PRC-barrel domain-containing protein n=1 Tax=Archangium sp. TaxID=1872627 RepID=UPI002D26708F|nr:PRC-barrel domain-containing protein [Archangium sp.]HYO53124.1 PRC-barrel domain-containing protein [Archangium sp.]
MIDPGDIHEGMTVRDTDGRKLGTVSNVGDTHFELGQGWPARRDYMVHFHRVERVQGRDVYLASAPTAVPPEDDLPPNA